MQRPIAALMLVPALSLVTASCSGEEDGINREGAVFDALAPEASIQLSGSDPAWSIEVTPASSGDGYSARASLPGEPAETPFAVKRFAGNNGLGFSGEALERPVQIAITPGECTDAASATVASYTASVKWGDDLLLGCAFVMDDEAEEPPTD